jgi:hypothetical protein
MRPDADEMFQDNAAITSALVPSVPSKIVFGPWLGEYVGKIGTGCGVERKKPLIKVKSKWGHRRLAKKWRLVCPYHATGGTNA